jgi:hypothetical protein
MPPMYIRWICRGLCICLLLICTVAWVGSYFEEVYLFHGNHGTLSILGLNGGFLYLYVQPNPMYSSSESHWVHHPPIAGAGYDGYRGSTYHFAGIAYQPTSDPTSGWSVDLSMWLVTVGLILVLWFVWRKTRRKITGGAFPVEPARRVS